MNIPIFYYFTIEAFKKLIYLQCLGTKFVKVYN